MVAEVEEEEEGGGGGGGGGAGGGETVACTDADRGAPAQVTWPWMPVPEYSDTSVVGAWAWNASSQVFAMTFTVNRATPPESVTSAPAGFAPTPKRASAANAPAMSIVGQPSVAAAFHRAVSSAVSPVRSTLAVAPIVRAPSIPMSDITTIGMYPTGLPVPSVARTSTTWLPGPPGAAPFGVDHTIWSWTPPTACWISATVARRCAIT